jgi:dTDP-4-dehydrorhamnose reductase
LARKILITGAEGQLGKALQIGLTDKFNILSTTRQPTQLAKNQRNVQKLDITDNENISSILKYFKPDIIINCAAYTNVDGSEINKELAHQVNVEGLQNLIQLSDINTYLIQISSDYVFDGANGPYSEDEHTFPVNYYGKTKLEAENILRGTRRKWAIFRPNVLYSSDLFCNGNFFAWVYQSLLKKQSISVVTDQISNPTLTQNFVNCIFQCIIMDYEGILHIGSDDYISRYEFALEIANVFDLDSNLITKIDTKSLSNTVKSYIAERPLHSGLIIDKIEKELNISTHSTNYNLKLLRNELN